MPKKLVALRHWPSHPKVNWVITYRQGGKRHVKYFKHQADAKNFANLKLVELTNEGRRHATISDAERRAIHEARDAGLDLASLVTEAIKARQWSSVKLDNLIDEFLDTKAAESRAGTHRKDLRLRLQRFADAQPRGVLVAAITVKDIDAWLTSLEVAPQTRINYRRAVHALFNFAVARGYAPRNVVSAAIRPRVVSKAPGILSVAQARALIGACAPEIVPAVAIGAFAGLRHAEIQRLTWDKVNVGRGYIEVSAVHSKTGRRRLVTMTANLKSWLAPAQRESGPVYPAGVYRVRFLEAVRMAGITSWPANALRHSAASYQLALSQNAAQTAFQLGHNETVLNNSYKELVGPKEAQEYFEIFPNRWTSR
jgi:integrase